MVLPAAHCSVPPPSHAPVPRNPARGFRGALPLVAATALVLGCVVLSLAVGSRQLDPVRVLQVLVSPDGSETSLIVRDLRLPRTLVGLVVGAALGLAGAQLQGLTR